MTMTEIIVKNANRSRKFGYSISTQPTGHGTDIAVPSSPRYTGTLTQIQKQIDDDRRYLNSIQSAYKNRAWFYDGKRIEAIWTIGCVTQCGCGEEKCFLEGHDVYDYGWFRLPLIEGIDERGKVEIAGLEKDGSLRLRLEE